jgi:uncharacterized short protein YbdD (DUF466 family)
MLGRRSAGRAVGRAGSQSSSVNVVTLSKAKGPERGWFRQLLSLTRTVVGMPDYQRHVQHLRQCHPELSIPTERQFFDDFVRARYGDGPTRCC